MHNVETMFSARVKPWHNLGVVTKNALSSQEALIQSGLNWSVVQGDLYSSNNGRLEIVPDLIANIRQTDNKCLGVVTKKYRVLQNVEAFDFVNLLLGEGIEYESAGALNNGKTVWLLAKLPETEIVGDKIEPYLVFTNSHDGKNAIRVAVTPIRVVCQNTLNMALGGSKRIWSARHMGDLSDKMIQARLTLDLAKNYLLSLNEIGNQLSIQSINEQYSIDMSKILFPTKDNDSNRKMEIALKQQNDFLFRLQNAPDLENFRDTKWGVMNAITDSVLHSEPARQSKDYWENAFMNLLEGNTIIDKAYEYVLRN